MADLRGAQWRKPSRSNAGNGGNCVETALNLPGVVGLRDSKDPSGPTIVVTPGTWSTFTARVKAGAFDIA